MKVTFDRYICEQCRKEQVAESGLFGNAPFRGWIEVHAESCLEAPWEHFTTLEFCSWKCCRDFCEGKIKTPKKDMG